MLCNLEYLISVDERQSQPVKFETMPDAVIEHYLYIVKYEPY